MSVRLRLTLLYTAILALTLTAFGAVLYGSQVQSMYRSGEQRLAEMAGHIVRMRQWDRPPMMDDAGGATRPPPFPPGETFAFDMRGAPREGFGGQAVYVQSRTPAGDVAQRSTSLGVVTLPLSSAGLQALQNGETWLEAATAEDDLLLIYSVPVQVGEQFTEIVQVAISITGQQADLNTLRRNLLAGGGVATLAAFGAGWLLAGLALRPVHRITQTAQAIGAERDLARRVDHTGPNDEIGQLATTFNAMLGELQAAYQQVELALQQQREFVADVSHELRTPLTTLRGNLALLGRQPPISAEDREDILRDMGSESERLIRLVNDLLALARTQAGRQLRSEAVEIGPLVEDVCRQARQIDPRRSVVFPTPPNAAVLGDPDALKQILLILVDNALKHTTGAVTLAAEVTPQGILVRVEDSGPGIEPELLEHIFERFCRGQSVSTEPRFGLGLAIAKALVEAQGGRISVESQVEHGSVFRVLLPRPGERSEPGVCPA